MTNGGDGGCLSDAHGYARQHHDHVDESAIQIDSTYPVYVHGDGARGHDDASGCDVPLHAGDGGHGGHGSVTKPKKP